MKTHTTILLCEDSEIDVELTLNALADFRRDGTIDVVRDGVEALDYLYRKGSYAKRAAGSPALVLLDLKMPRMDGLEVLRTVKSDPLLKSTPVVMLSSSRQERDVSQSYQAGVNAYVVKPVDAEKFTRVLEQTGEFWTMLNEIPPFGDRGLHFDPIL
jgi:two-component system response regulator